MTDAINLKDTVLTPKTDFPMKANLAQREKETLANWKERGLYEEIRKARKGAKKWILHDGPPYANGDAHTGTGLNKVLKDLTVRFRTMQGYDSPFVPGWDCQGLPIEQKVLDELGGRLPEGTTPLDVRRRCLAYAGKWIDVQREQYKRALCMGRWEKPYLTTNPVYEAGVLDCFADLYERGYVARHKKPVHWSWAARSALAEAELEYEDRTDLSIYVKFEVDLEEQAPRKHFDKVSAAAYPNRTGGPPLPPWFKRLLTEAESRRISEATDYLDQFKTCTDAEPHIPQRRLDDLRKLAGDTRLFCLVWTTTPWTLPANVAVAFNPTDHYSFVRVIPKGQSQHEIWIVAKALVEKIVKDTGCTVAELVRPEEEGASLTGLTYVHALWATRGHELVPADYVTMDDGTGLVHTAPGHGAEDFQTGQKFVLPTVCPVDDDGRYYKGERLLKELGLEGMELSARAKDWLAFLEGKRVLDVEDKKYKKGHPDERTNDQIVARLKEQGSLVHAEPYRHSYPHCWRTHAPVIFRATEQWFVKVDEPDESGIKLAHAPASFDAAKPLRKRLLDDISRVQWFPAWGQKRISGMVESRPDWCISRQRIWGIPIPAFADVESGELCISKETLRHVAALVRQHGSDIWFDDANWPIDKLLPDAARPAKFKGRKLRKMSDIFDVWFESGASHRSVVVEESGDGHLAFPADLYLEGDDQHRGWFQVSLILSAATQGCSPFKQCLTLAFVVDEHGQKGSKSKGNLVAMDKACDDLGADLLRLYYASVNTSDPVPFSLALVREKTSNSYRTLRNTLRVMLGNLAGFESTHETLPFEELVEPDRWVLSRLSHTVEQVTAALERYEFHVATRLLVEFCNVELSAFYIDVTKDRLYCDAPASHARRSARTATWLLASSLARMVAPICPHTADEAWQHLPGAAGQHWSVHLAEFPKAADYPRDEALEHRYARLFKIKAEADRMLDRMRKDGSLKNSTAARMHIHADDAELASTLDHFEPRMLASLLGVSEALRVAERSMQAENAPGLPGLALAIGASAYPRCERCWNHWESVKHRADIGAAICDRCHDVVAAG